MRILHIINSLATGGAEKLIVDSVLQCNKKGVKVDVLLFSGVKHPLHEELQKMQVCNIFHFGNGSVYNPLHILKIIPYFKKYDLIHVHLFPALYFVAIAKWISFSKIKIIFTEHNTTNTRIKHKVFLIPEKLIYKTYHKIICISDEISKVLRKHINLPDEKIIIIENGIDFIKFSQAESVDRNEIEQNLTSKDFLLMQISGFRKQKDHKTLIKSLLHLPINVKVVLVGVGALMDDCKQYVEVLGLNDRVIFLGTRNDVPGLLKSCDVVVLSSHYEGLSLSSLEGMASGRPFVASDVPGLRNIVKGAGVLFPKGNSRGLAGEILRLMRDEKYYDRIVLKCKERAAMYSLDEMIKKHLLLYKQL